MNRCVTDLLLWISQVSSIKKWNETGFTTKEMPEIIAYSITLWNELCIWPKFSVILDVQKIETFRLFRSTVFFTPNVNTSSVAYLFTQLWITLLSNYNPILSDKVFISFILISSSTYMCTCTSPVYKVNFTLYYFCSCTNPNYFAIFILPTHYCIMIMNYMK